jgi:acyl carrier protein
MDLALSLPSSISQPQDQHRTPSYRPLISELIRFESLIEDTAQLPDLGIDSLIGMELTREIEAAFRCRVHARLLFEPTDFQSHVRCVEEALGVSTLDKHQKIRLTAQI